MQNETNAISWFTSEHWLKFYVWLYAKIRIKLACSKFIGIFIWRTPVEWHLYYQWKENGEALPKSMAHSVQLAYEKISTFSLIKLQRIVALKEKESTNSQFLWPYVYLKVHTWWIYFTGVRNALWPTIMKKPYVRRNISFQAHISDGMRWVIRRCGGRSWHVPSAESQGLHRSLLRCW